MRNHIYHLATTGVGLLLIASCATVRPHQASFSGQSTFSRNAPPLGLPVVVLGSGPRLADVASISMPSDVGAGGGKELKDVAELNRAVLLAERGIAAAHANDLLGASRSLDEAIAVMGGHVATAKDAQARALFFSTESRKTFRGEPHERAVMFIYRGLVYLADGDADNAQACFKSAALKDALATGKEDRADWLTADLLLYLTQCLAVDPNRQDWARNIESRYGAEGSLPDGWSKAHRNPVVVVVVAGRGPIKQSQMLAKGELMYLEVPTHADRLEVAGVRGSVICAPTDRPFVQAATRGKREMDKVLAGKAAVRKGFRTAGDVVNVVGGVVSAIPYVGLIGTAMTYAANAAKLASEGIHSDADTRSVGLVPAQFYVYVGDASELGGHPKLRIIDREDCVLAEGTIDLPRKPDRLSVVLARFSY